MDWRRWHDQYDQPDSPLARRLRTVQSRIRDVLDRCPPSPLRIISLCAGQGRDLIPVLGEHPRRDDARARLVELDPDLCAAARQAARSAGLAQVEVVTGDAALTNHYNGMVPVDLVLLCGVFGNVSDPDIGATIRRCPQLCATGGSVVWTRHRNLPDRVPLICRWFAEQGFDLVWLSEPHVEEGVGVHRFRGIPLPLERDVRMFRFVDYDVMRT